MKKLSLNLSFAALLLLSGFAFASCSSDDDDMNETTISAKDLPQKAQDFLSEYFPNVMVGTVEMESVATTVIYEVDLADGTDIVFNYDGDWQQVEAPDGKTIPTGFIMEEIVTYVNDNYQGFGINEINHSGEGYIVEINSADEVTLTFNELGEYTGTISNY